jgi:hypothetical protein
MAVLQPATRLAWFGGTSIRLTATTWLFGENVASKSRTGSTRISPYMVTLTRASSMSSCARLAQRSGLATGR